MIKKLLLLTPLLLLSSCSKGKVFINVDYTFDYNRLQYVVTTSNYDNYFVDTKNKYDVKVDQLKVKDNIEIYNEFYKNTNELFVYHLN